jgi:guanylate kinase
MHVNDVSLNPLLQHEAPAPSLIVLSGSSGVGKDTVLMRMRELGFPFHFIVTMNSRPMRPGEIDGVDYHFVSTQAFEQLIEQGELLEWARVYGHYRGIPKSEIRQGLASGRDVVLRVNVDGAMTIKQIIPAAILIFIAPGSIEELRHRLTLRRTDAPDEIERRLALVQEELAYVPRFDYVVINHEDRLDETVGHIRAIITAEKHRVFLPQIRV